MECGVFEEYYETHPRHRHLPLLSSPTSAPALLELPCQEQRGSGLTTTAPPAHTNGAWPLRQLVSLAQKNKPPNMLSFNVQFIDLPMDCTVPDDKTIEGLLNTCLGIGLAVG